MMGESGAQGNKRERAAPKATKRTETSGHACTAKKKGDEIAAEEE